VVYTAGSHVWMRSLIAPEPLQVTAGDTFSWGPAWSPDGNNLAMYLWKEGAIRIGVWNRESRKLLVFPVQEVSGRLPILWHPSGLYLLFAAPRELPAAC
jgi:hypothetical protein